LLLGRWDVKWANVPGMLCRVPASSALWTSQLAWSTCTPWAFYM
jgi:hypothetical protein